MEVIGTMTTSLLGMEIAGVIFHGRHSIAPLWRIQTREMIQESGTCGKRQLSLATRVRLSQPTAYAHMRVHQLSFGSNKGLIALHLVPVFIKHGDNLRKAIPYENIRLQRYDGNTARLAHRSDEALGVCVSVSRIVPSLLDLGRGVPRAVHPTLKQQIGECHEICISENFRPAPKIASSRCGPPPACTAPAQSHTRIAVVYPIDNRLTENFHWHVVCPHQDWSSTNELAFANPPSCGAAAVELETTFVNAYDDADEGEARHGATSELKGAGETGDTRENPPTSDIVRHDSHMRKSGNRTRFTWVGGEQTNHYITADPVAISYRLFLSYLGFNVIVEVFSDVSPRIAAAIIHV
ncbi:hypothetical protein PR048_008611 [Dryococelus australis]|uniref:Uncharacterized protein n=1 Tax=Dryococelus australis TaxID=614101 RepID=A0ABQ9HXW4_9NEOP|nr:hypothetical protein PR048_008611 [Dryococelus australis]